MNCLSWVAETSFSFYCDGKTLIFNCNTGKFILEIKKNDDKMSVFLFSNGIRVTFDGYRLFDMHNLKVTKGEESKQELTRLLQDASSDINEGISLVGNYYGVPVKLVKKLVNDFTGSCNVEPEKYLGFDIRQVKISFGKEFSKESATFESKTYAEIEIGKDGCLKAKVYFDGSKSSFMTSDDCQNFIEDNDDFLIKLRSLNVLLEEYSDIVKSLEKWVE